MFKESYYEAIGTFLLALIVSASGYFGYVLTEGNSGITLLINSVVTGVGLYVLIVIFRPLSGAQFNPIVSILLWIKRKQTIQKTIMNSAMQVIGAIAGVLFMHLLFDLTVIQSSVTIRSSLNLWISELFSSLVLLFVIIKTFDLNDNETGTLVGSTVMLGYWVTSSTFFANPALTIARSFTNTFVGIRINDVGMFVLFQLVAVIIIALIYRKELLHSLEKK